jgi:ADP-ribose pyrophosphatase YjhB (NUDIX family)
MHLTIYYNSKPLILCTEITKEIDQSLHQNDVVFIDELNSNGIKHILEQMNLSNVKRGIFLHNDLEELFEAFKKEFQFIQAAGGLVHTEQNDCLLIYRKGKWDLPKGKLDEGEVLDKCAVREVQEETGINAIKLEKQLCITFHTYHQDDKHYLKESHWYLMKANTKEVLTPQTEEDIEKCEWVAIDDLAPYIENMHASVVDVLKAGIQELGEAKKV